jgi:hypothetical protein
MNRPYLLDLGQWAEIHQASWDTLEEAKLARTMICTAEGHPESDTPTKIGIYKLVEGE